MIHHNETDPIVIICQGPPACDGKPTEEMPCPWCKQIVCHPDGSETITEPHHA